MSSPYVRDLSWEVACRLEVNDVFLFSILSDEWLHLIDKECWMNKFIRDFGSNLENRVYYELDCLVMEMLDVDSLYKYVIRSNYIRLLAIMIGKWERNIGTLIIASNYGRIGAVKLLLANGASIHAWNGQALISAAANGHLEVVEFLLANGADIHAQEDEALIIAAEHGYLSIVKFLVANGADIHAEDDNALIYAAYYGYIAIVEFLLANGADIHTGEDKALVLAARNGHLEVVKLLLSNGADIHAQNDSVLIYSTKEDNLDMFELLIENGVNICAPSNNWLVYRTGPNVLEFLIENNIIVNNGVCLPIVHIFSGNIRVGYKLIRSILRCG